MPPRKRTTRSSAAAAASSSRQNTLSFAGKVTKPVGHAAKDLDGPRSEASTKAKATDVEPIAKPDVESVASDASIEATETAAPAPVSKPDAPAMAIRAAPPARSDDEVRAAKVTAAQITKYWKAKEAGRIYPRVHQQGIAVHEKVLREFDLSSQYGPCIGIPRTRRWQRARKLGLNPPIEVLAVLLKEAERKKDVQVAYVDELMGTKGLDQGVVEEVR